MRAASNRFNLLNFLPNNLALYYIYPVQLPGLLHIFFGKILINCRRSGPGFNGLESKPPTAHGVH